MKIATALGVLSYLCTLFVLGMLARAARSGCRVGKTKGMTTAPDDGRMMNAVEAAKGENGIIVRYIALILIPPSCYVILEEQPNSKASSMKRKLYT